MAITHDELLIKIDDSTNGLKHEDIFPLLLANTNALRAVVKLCNKWENRGSYCLPIEDIIKAIEKELR